MALIPLLSKWYFFHLCIQYFHFKLNQWTCNSFNGVVINLFSHKEGLTEWAGFQTMGQIMLIDVGFFQTQQLINTWVQNPKLNLKHKLSAEAQTDFLRAEEKKGHLICVHINQVEKNITNLSSVTSGTNTALINKPFQKKLFVSSFFYLFLRELQFPPRHFSYIGLSLSFARDPSDISGDPLVEPEEF